MATQETVYGLAQELLKVAPQCPEDLVEAKLREIAYSLLAISQPSLPARLAVPGSKAARC